MRYSTNAKFNSQKVCLPNTQTAILDKIFQWVASDTLSASDGERKSIFLLHGWAGTGKSTIANTIAQRLFAMKRLGASFCFSRDDRINRNAANMFSTIASGMADLDPCFKVKLAEALDDRSVRTSGKFMSINLVIVSHL
jgi:pantothenate kinase-related protein Tda10